MLGTRFDTHHFLWRLSSWDSGSNAGFTVVVKGGELDQKEVSQQIVTENQLLQRPRAARVLEGSFPGLELCLLTLLVPGCRKVPPPSSFSPSSLSLTVKGGQSIWAGVIFRYEESVWFLLDRPDRGLKHFNQRSVKDGTFSLEEKSTRCQINVIVWRTRQPWMREDNLERYY